MAGLLAIMPLILTVAIVSWVVKFLRDIVGPDTYIGKLLASIGVGLFKEADKAGAGTGGIAEALQESFLAYLIGIILVVILLFTLGVFVEFGARRFFQSMTDRFVRRVPVIGGLYGSLKQLVDLFDRKDESELKAMSVVFCHFAAGGGPGVLALMPSPEKMTINGEEYHVVIIPTAPVPFGGGLVFIPAPQVKPIDMSVDNFISIYVSMGVSTPQFIQGANK